jgi:prepilin-type N-terminal cleavage/methylation domain-containing protein
MSFSKNIKQQGFTIVELLIVIVVIGILAAITIVAYNGIQNRGKTAAAQSAANTVIKKAEAANAAGTTAGYPTTTAGFLAANAAEAALAGSGITLAAISTAPAAPATVEYLPCTNVSGVGATVAYWDYSATTPVKVSKIIGAACTTYGAALAAVY